jgi:FkbM family methyltransferase
MSNRLLTRGRVALRERLRNRFGKRVVVRTVAGATLALPWSHRLPDYVDAFPSYGRNLVDLAEALQMDGRPLQVLDVGANIGDSALQILARVDARVLCVDGDRYWLPFLDRNTKDEPRITVEPVLIVERADATPLVPVRQCGTTRFVSGLADAAAEQITAAELRRRHAEFDDIRLIKSDTDGFDCRIVPPLARAWLDAGPVLFFEYDPGLTRRSGDEHPERVWDELGRLGYVHAAAWTNFGIPIGNGTVADMRDATPTFTEPGATGGYHYWDVAVAKGDDDQAAAAFRRLAPDALSRAES